MGRYAVQTEELADVVARMSAFEQQLEQAIETADRKVARMHAVWSGAAAAEHRAAHDRWKADVAQMRAALQRMRAIAHTAHGNYTATVTTNSGMWSGL